MIVQNKNDWVLEPFVRVGIFKFGENYSTYLRIPDLLEPWDEEDQREDTIVFDVVGTSSYISVDEKGKIDTVYCRDECNYTGVNLIGKPLEEVESVLKVKAIYDENLAEQDIYTIDELGLTVWVKDGLVSIIDCSIYIDPNEVD
jgi:hypothetical protein